MLRNVKIVYTLYILKVYTFYILGCQICVHAYNYIKRNLQNVHANIGSFLGQK